VRKELLRPRWLALHVLAVVVALVMLRLGLWQWHRARARHSLQNYSYAFEWVLFAAFTLVAYAKLARDELRDREAPGAAEGPSAVQPELDPPPPSRPVAAPPSDEDDDELAAYNRYLASLHDRS